jgi:protein SCO1/2
VIRPTLLLLVGGVAMTLGAGCKPKNDGPLVMLTPPKQGETADLQRYWQLPEFSLTERSGAPVSLGDLKGKVWVADFFYSTCPGPCPMMTSRLSEIHKRLSGEGDVRFVSITTDPQKDTPEILQAYAKNFGASDRWLFLTGDKAAIFALAHDGFKLSVTEDPGAPEPITHSTKLVLVDRTGTVRGLYEGVGEDDSDRLVKDIQRLLAEKS